MGSDDVEPTGVDIFFAKAEEIDATAMERVRELLLGMMPAAPGAHLGGVVVCALWFNDDHEQVAPMLSVDVMPRGEWSKRAHLEGQFQALLLTHDVLDGALDDQSLKILAAEIVEELGGDDG